MELKCIVENEGIPRHFLSKILQILVRKKLLVSTKGPSGGYKLAKKASDISLYDVIEAIDGPEIFDKCGILNRTCNEENTCILHERFRTNMKNIKQLYTTEKVNCIETFLSESDLVKLADFSITT